MLLEVAGVPYTGFESAALNIRLDRLCNNFVFQATSTGPEDEGGLPFVQGQSCRVLIDGEQMFSGWIEDLKIGFGSRTHTITVGGRDRPCDFLDATVGVVDDITERDLKKIIELLIAHVEIKGLEVVDRVHPEPFNEAEDLGAPDIGDGAFAFVDELCRKRKVMLTSDGYGRIVMISGQGQAIPDHVLHLRDSPENNVELGSVGFKGANRFNRYEVLSQLNPSIGSIFAAQSDEILAEALGFAIDSGARPGRQMVILAELAMSSEQAKLRAEWEAKIRKIRSETYSVIMTGYRARQSGDIWRVNTVPTVRDDYCGIDGPMLINEITYSMVAQGKGRTVAMSLVQENAYTAALDDPDNAKIGGPKGNAKQWTSLREELQDEAAGDEIAVLASTSGPPDEVEK